MKNDERRGADRGNQNIRGAARRIYPDRAGDLRGGAPRAEGGRSGDYHGNGYRGGSGRPA